MKNHGIQVKSDDEDGTENNANDEVRPKQNLLQRIIEKADHLHEAVNKNEVKSVREYNKKLNAHR